MPEIYIKIMLIPCFKIHFSICHLRSEDNNRSIDSLVVAKYRQHYTIYINEIIFAKHFGAMCHFSQTVIGRYDANL